MQCCRRRLRRQKRRRLFGLPLSLLPLPAFSKLSQTFLIRVATADLRALLYTRCFSARRCLWSAFCLANTTTEPRAAGGADAELLEGESRAVPLTDDVDASDGFLRAGAGVDTARPEKALASIVWRLRGGRGRAKKLEALLENRKGKWSEERERRPRKNKSTKRNFSLFLSKQRELSRPLSSFSPSPNQ